MSARASVSIAASLSLPLVTSFAGAQTLWWPSATAARPRVVLLFIPGNPGLSSYYIDFLHSIYTQLSSTSSEGGSGGIEILAMSHRGYVLDLGRNAHEGAGPALARDPKVADLYLGGLHG